MLAGLLRWCFRAEGQTGKPKISDTPHHCKPLEPWRSPVPTPRKPGFHPVTPEGREAATNQSGNPAPHLLSTTSSSSSLGDTSIAVSSLQASVAEALELGHGGWGLHDLVSSLRVQLGASVVRLYGFDESAERDQPGRLVVLACDGSGAADMLGTSVGVSTSPSAAAGATADGMYPFLRSATATSFCHAGRVPLLLQRAVESRRPATYRYNPSASNDGYDDPAADMPADVAQDLAAMAGPPSSTVFAAVPLLSREGHVLGVLWVGSVEAPGQHDRATEAQAGTQRSRSSGDSGGAASVLRSPGGLQQLGVSVSLTLLAVMASGGGCGGGGRGSGGASARVRWLSRTLWRLAACRTLHALVAELQGAVSEHVRAAFMVDVVVQAALVPGPDSGVAYMLTPELAPEAEPPAAANDGSAHGSPAPRMAGRSRMNSAGPKAVKGLTGQDRCSREMMHRSTFSACQPRLPAVMALESTLYSSSRPVSSRRLATVSPLSLAAAAPAPTSTTSTAAAQHIIPLFAKASADGLLVNGNTGGTCASEAVPIPIARAGSRRAFGPPGAPHASTCELFSAAAAPPPPSLHAKAFELSHTLLRRLVAAKDGKWPAAGTGTGTAAAAARPPGPPPAGEADGVRSLAAVVDCARWVQDVRQPSRDVYMLMASLLAAAAPPPPPPPEVAGGFASTSSVRRPISLREAANAPAAAPPPTPVAAGGRGAMHSLLLVGVQAAPAAAAAAAGGGGAEGGEGPLLALYLGFATPLPPPLLEAVRKSVCALLSQSLAAPIRAKLLSDLTPELSTLLAGQPGSYAVLPSYGSGTMLSYISPGASAVVTGTGAGPTATLSNQYNHLMLLESVQHQSTALYGSPPPGGLSGFSLLDTGVAGLGLGGGGRMPAAGTNGIQTAMATAAMLQYTALPGAGLAGSGALYSSHLQQIVVQGLVDADRGQLLTAGGGGQSPRVRRSATLGAAEGGGGGGGGEAELFAADKVGAGIAGAPGRLLTTSAGNSPHHPKATHAAAGSRHQGPKWLTRRMFAADADASANTTAGSLSAESPFTMAVAMAAAAAAVSPQEVVELLHESRLLGPEGQGGGSGSAARGTATLLAVHQVDSCSLMRSHMGLLVESVMSTLPAANASLCSSAAIATFASAPGHRAASSPLSGSSAHNSWTPHGAGGFSTSNRIAAGVAEGGFASSGGEDELDDLQLFGVLGEGACGVVMRGLLGATPVAVKLMELPEEEPPSSPPAGGAGARRGVRAPAEGDDTTRLQARQAMLRNAMEIGVMRSVSHVNIVQCLGVYSDVRLERSRGPYVGDQFGCVLRRCPQLQSLTCSNNNNIITSASTNASGGGGSDSADGSEVSSPLCAAIVTELADVGSLEDVLADRLFPVLRAAAAGGGGGSGLPGGAVDMQGVYLVLLEVALALRHLHSRRLVHRDLKPANVLLKASPTDPRGWSCKLADFGFALVLDRRDAAPQPAGQGAAAPGSGGAARSQQRRTSTSHGFALAPGPAASAASATQSGAAPAGSVWSTYQEQACGTVTHMAPEAMIKNARIDASVDSFSFGVLMWEIMCGRGSRPYPNLHPADIPRAVRGGMRPIFQQGVPAAYRRLAQACWDSDPLRRPSSAALVVAIKAQLSQYTAEVAAQRHLAAAQQAAAAQAVAAVAAAAAAAATHAAAAQAAVMAAARAALGGRGRDPAAPAATPAAAAVTPLEAQEANTPVVVDAGKEVGQW